MTLNGNQRGGAKDLALHLMKAENEVVELHELRGFISHDLMGALNEMHAISRATRCSQFMYSLSLNPPPNATVSIAEFEKAIEQAEKRLGLVGQPRAVVFHEKFGRRHCHVAWSRIDTDTMTARQMSYDHEKLTTLSKELFLEYGWEMPCGLEKREERSSLNYTHAQHQQAQRVGKHAAQVKADLLDAWTASDSKAAFEAALAERGYFLAQGDRGRFVVVDQYGEVYSIRQQTKLRVKELRAKLGDEKDLSSVAEILAQLEKTQSAQPNQQQKQAQRTYTTKEALAKVTRYHAAFTPKMMERSLKQVIPDKTARDRIIAELLQSNELIRIGERKEQAVYATQEAIDQEKIMANNAQDMMKNTLHRIDNHAAQRAIFNLNNKLAKETGGRASLSAEQTKALRHMASDKQLSLVVGVAGAGKTTIMEGAKEALESQGYRVRGAAPSGIAASGLKEIGLKASTLHSLEYRMELAQKILDENAGKSLTPRQHEFIQSAMLTNKDVLIVDEAGMVSAKQLANIVERCKQFGAKLVLVGDPEQLQSVEAGAAFRNLLERNTSVSLTEVRRQKTDWQREATKLFGVGKTTEALTRYHEQGCFAFSKSRNDAKEQLVDDVMQAQKASPEKSHLVLAYTRKDVADLNAMIKAERVRAGKVEAIDTALTVTINDGETEHQQQQGFAAGDRILFRKNDAKLGVMNGTFATIDSLEDSTLHVTLDDGTTRHVDNKDYNHIQIGYAATVHKSQGVTVDETYVLATPHFDRHTSYVAMSRHKEKLRVYASKNDFKRKSSYKTLSQDGEKLSTLDFTDAREKQAVPQKEPEQKGQTRQSFLRRLWHSVTRKQEKPMPEPVKEAKQQPILRQQQFIKQRDELLQSTKTAEAQHSVEPERQQNYIHRLER